MAPRCSAEQRNLALVAEGDRALDAGDLEEAINKYRAAYYGLNPKGRVSYAGSLTVRTASQAFGLLYDAKKDPAILERQIAFIDEFFADIDASGSDHQVDASVLEEMRAVRAQAEQTLESLSPPEPEPEPEPESEPEPEPEPSESLPSARSDDPPPSAPRTPNWLGIGLTAGGGLLTAVGGGVLVGWWTIRHGADRYVSLTEGFEEGTEARAEYLEQQRQDAQAFRIAGSVLVSAGLATVAGGVVHIILKRKSPKRGTERLTLWPRAGRHMTGVVLERRF